MNDSIHTAGDTSILSLSNIFSVLDQTLQKKKQGKSGNKSRSSRITILMIILIGTILALVAYNEHKLLKNFEFILHIIKNLVQSEMATSPVFGISLIFTIEFIIYQFFLPLVSIYNLLVVYLLQNPLLSYIVIFVSCMANSFFTYFVVRKCMKDKIDKEISKSKILKKILEKLEGKDWQMFFLIKLLTLPATLKNLVLGSLDIKSHVLFFGNLIFYGALSFKFCLIGSGIREIEDIFSGHDKDWRERSMVQKLGFLVVLAVILFNVFFVGYIGSNLKKFMEEEENEEEMEGFMSENMLEDNEEDTLI